MTNEEAIELLKNVAWLGTDNGTYVYEALEMAIKALEEQKPEVNYPKGYPRHCPFCGEKLIFARFCPHCGHLILYKEEDE